MRGEPNTKVVLTIFRKAESRTFPVTIIARGDPHAERARQDGRAGLRAGCASASSRTARSTTSSRKLEELYKQDPNLKGLVLDLRNDPGGLLEGAVAISAAFLPRRRRSSSRPTARSPIRKSTFKASPEFYQRRGGADPLRAPAGGASRRCRWWCWSTKARPRPARSSPARCRTTSAPPSWARRPSARARCRRCASSSPDTGAEDHHRALLHAERPLDPGQGHRARRHARRDRRRQPVRRPAHARSRPREAPAERPGRREEGRGAREGARGSAQEARGRSREAARRAASRCPSSAAPRTSSWRRRSTG